MSRRKSAEQSVVSGSQRSQKAGLRSRIMSLFRSKGHLEKSESASEKVKNREKDLVRGGNA
ncbi:hypothetical protein Hanom_Chr11g01038651 [Helianthus anomalus]